MARHFGPHIWRKLLGAINFDWLGMILYALSGVTSLLNIV